MSTKKRKSNECESIVKEQGLTEQSEASDIDSDGDLTLKETTPDSARAKVKSLPASMKSSTSLLAILVKVQVRSTLKL